MPKYKSRVFIVKLLSCILWFYIIHITDISFAADLQYLQKASLVNRELVKVSQNNIEAAEKTILIANSKFYPSIDVSTNFSTNDSGSNVSYDELTSVVAGAKMNIFKGFADKYGLLIAEYNQIVSEYNYQKTLQDVLLLVSQRFLDVYEKKDNLIVAKDNLKTIETNYHDNLNKFQAGYIGKSELLKFQADMNNAHLEQLKAESMLENSLIELQRESKLKLALSNLEFDYFQVLPVAKSLEEYELEMLTKRSEIKTYEKLIEIAEANVEISYGKLYPQIDLVGNYRKFGDISQDIAEYNSELAVQLVMTLNIFEGYATKSTIEKNTIEVNTLKLERQELIDEYKRDLSKRYNDFILSINSTAAALSAIDYANEDLRITKDQYNGGLQSESDLLEAIANLTKTKYNYLAVVKSIFTNYFELERMTENFYTGLNGEQKERKENPQEPLIQ